MSEAKIATAFSVPFILALVLGLFFLLGHLTVQVPRFPQRWSTDATIEILACPGVSTEIVEKSMNNLTGKVDKEIRSWSISSVDYCFCEDGLTPLRGTIEIYQSYPQVHGTKLGAGVTKRFWSPDDEIISACTMIPLSSDERFDVSRITTHELTHAFGWSHAYMFGWHWRVDDSGQRDELGSETDGWGDPFHLMYKSVCNTCTSLRGIGQ